MIYTYIAAALIAAIVAGGGVWKVQGWRFDSMEKQRIEAAAKEQGIRIQRIDTAAVGYEGDKRELRTEFIVITEEVERVVKQPFYADGGRCLDDDGLRQLTDAIRPAAPASQPAGTVPRPGTAR